MVGFMREPLTNSISITELRHMREDEHLTNKEIAERIGVHPATVLRYIGPDVRKPDHPNETSRGRRVTTGLIAEIRDMYVAGGSIAGIAQKVGLSWKTVKKYTSDLPSNRKAIAKPEAPTVAETPAEPEPIAVAVVEPEEPKGEKSMFQVMSKRQTIRLKGMECEYELELGGGTDTVTIINDGAEVAVLDAGMLQAFIEELKQLRCQYLDG